MSTPINLNRARKQRARDNKRKQGDENAAKFGRTKGARVGDKTQVDKARRDLDGHKIE